MIERRHQPYRYIYVVLLSYNVVDVWLLVKQRGNFIYPRSGGDNTSSGGDNTITYLFRWQRCQPINSAVASKEPKATDSMPLRQQKLGSSVQRVYPLIFPGEKRQCNATFDQLTSS